jgi:hypothetical protein
LIWGGILLLVAPWTPRLWEHNAFLSVVPGLATAMESLFIRGAVSGIGIVTFLGGVREFLSMMSPRPGADVPTIDSRMP